MPYFKDLTNYQYLLWDEKNPNEYVFNVGWLDEFNDFPKGETSQEFKDKLRFYFKFPQQQTCGFRSCCFCYKEDGLPKEGQRWYISDSEIWIVGKNNKIYASPKMIVHYVEQHNYLPPPEFIEAVLNGPLPGSDEYNNIISEANNEYKDLEKLMNDNDIFFSKNRDGYIVCNKEFAELKIIIKPKNILNQSI